ncbi:FecR family protein [Gynurincola endophyticus]|uniref:FecR family protein n=1 Tax=Gynurincola endophyticus TaxID=2479004 RepID=UPI000F8E603C|nr:FecR family protein [Gynurincola endophyticus]
MDKSQPGMNELPRLFQKVLKNEATEDEKRALADAARDPRYAEVIAQLLDESFADEQNAEPLEGDVQNMILNAIWQSEKSDEKELIIPVRKSIYSNWLRVAAAVIVVVGLGVLGLTLFRNEADVPVTKGEHILPAQEGITLRLSNGKTVQLNDSIPDLQLEEIGGAVSRAEDGTLVYKTTDNASTPDLWNTVSTGKGQSVAVVLPDNSRIWLNANSSIKYSSNLSNAEERYVEIEGEAFFEVAKQFISTDPAKRKPFLVKTPQQLVKVLGTQFNISTYQQNITYTTLVEGSIEVNVAEKKELLKPGQQSIVKNKQLTEIINVNTDQVTAWRNGIFYFDQYTIDQALNEVQNWYDVSIIFEGEKTKEVFSGMISRHKPLSELLDMLEKTGAVKFKVMGNKIHVLQ